MPHRLGHQFSRRCSEAGPRQGWSSGPGIHSRSSRATGSAALQRRRSKSDTKAPLIVALHGRGGDGNSLLRGAALALAEEGGYILVGPMGYNPSGWHTR